jgi:hypothetical protein
MSFLHHTTIFRYYNVIESLPKKICIAGIAFIFCIKFIIRPYLHVPSYFQIFVDVAPNFICGLIFPFMIYWLSNNLIHLKTKLSVQAACIIAFLGLTVNEFSHLMPIFKRTFDVHDIIFSAIGIFTNYASYSYFYKTCK